LKAFSSTRPFFTSVPALSNQLQTSISGWHTGSMKPSASSSARYAGSRSRCSSARDVSASACCRTAGGTCCIAMSAWISLFARTCRSWRIAATAVVANTISEQKALQNSTDTLGNFAPFVASRRA